MPVPAVYGAVLASAQNVQSGSSISSGRQAVGHLENLPLLVAQDSCHAITEKHYKLPRFVHRMIAKSVVKRLKGVIFVVAASLALSWVPALALSSAKALPTAETVFWRSFSALVLNYVAIGFRRVKLKVKRKLRKPLMLTAAAYWVAAVLGLYAMQRLPLGNAQIILYTSPLLTYLLAWRVLKEKILWFNLAAAVVAYAGVVFVAQPTFLFPQPTRWHLPFTIPLPHAPRWVRLAMAFMFGNAVAYLCAGVSAAAQTCVFVGLRSLQKVPHLVVLHYVLLLSTLLSLAAVLAFQQRFTIAMTIEAWGVALGTGALTFVGLLFLVRGFQSETAGTAATMRLLDVALLFAWDLALVDATATNFAIAGSVAIAAGPAAIIVRKLRSHWAAKRFGL